MTPDTSAFKLIFVYNCNEPVSMSPDAGPNISFRSFELKALLAMIFYLCLSLKLMLLKVFQIKKKISRCLASAGFYDPNNFVFLKHKKSQKVDRFEIKFSIKFNSTKKKSQSCRTSLNWWNDGWMTFWISKKSKKTFCWNFRLFFWNPHS